MYNMIDALLNPLRKRNERVIMSYINNMLIFYRYKNSGMYEARKQISFLLAIIFKG